MSNTYEIEQLRVKFQNWLLLSNKIGTVTVDNQTF